MIIFKHVAPLVRSYYPKQTPEIVKIPFEPNLFWKLSLLILLDDPVSFTIA